MSPTLAPEEAGARQAPRGPSVKPALVVVGIAAGLLLLFGIGAALTGTHPSVPTRPRHPARTALAAVTATRALRPIERPDTPPSDVLGSLVVPRGTRTRGATPWSGTTQYSATMRFSLDGSQAAVVDFFHAQLRSRGWSIVTVGAAHGHPGATEVLAQRGSADGWYWEVGVVVSPTTFQRTGSAETTRFALDLFEEPDSQ